MRCAVIVIVLCGVVGSAWAQSPEWEAQEQQRVAKERLKQGLAELEQLKPIAPDPGVAKARVQPPTWCAKVKPPEATIDAIENSLSAQYTTQRVFDTARYICAFSPKARGIQVATSQVLQLWMNETGLSDTDAAASIAERLAPGYDADKQQLCSSLRVSDEVQGADRSFMAARSALFGCTQDQPLWWEGHNWLPDDLPMYLEQSASPPDDLVRAAVILAHSRFALDPQDSYFDQNLLSYIIDQVDYRAFDPARTLAMMNTAPYKSSPYARTVIMESVGRAKLALGMLDAEVKKKTADPGWKELLVTAPQRGIAAWNEQAAQYKDLLARSNDFEHRFWGPSRKALAGCWPALRKDFLGVAKTLKHGSGTEFEQALSTPVVGLLFSRLVLCGAVDHPDGAYLHMLIMLHDHVRPVRGPRAAAYYAALDALSQILQDRTRFPITMEIYKTIALHDTMRETIYKTDQHPNDMTYIGDRATGVVRSAKKVHGGVKLTFLRQRHKEMGFSCVDTNRILMWDAGGHPIYYRNCHNTGMSVVDTTPGPVTIPDEMAQGIKRGAVVTFIPTAGDSPKRRGVPIEVYSDKSKKHLVSFYGLPL